MTTTEDVATITATSDAASLLYAALHYLESESAELIPGHDDVFSMVNDARALVDGGCDASDADMAAALTRAAFVFIDAHMPTWKPLDGEDRICRACLRLAESRIRELAEFLAGVTGR